MTIPQAAAPITQPLTPPLALPMIAAHPVSKKQVEINGITTVGNIPDVSNSVIIDVIIATINPINNAFGA